MFHIQTVGKFDEARSRHVVTLYITGPDWFPTFKVNQSKFLETRPSIIFVILFLRSQVMRWRNIPEIHLKETEISRSFFSQERVYA